MPVKSSVFATPAKREEYDNLLRNVLAASGRRKIPLRVVAEEAHVSPRTLQNVTRGSALMGEMTFTLLSRWMEKQP